MFLGGVDVRCDEACRVIFASLMSLNSRCGARCSTSRGVNIFIQIIFNLTFFHLRTWMLMSVELSSQLLISRQH